MKRLAALAFILLLTAPLNALATAQEVSSTDLIENALTLDGETVTYTGEVIGDILKRGDHTWLNLSDGSNAIGIWVDTEQLGDVSIPGRYEEHGDEVRITGVFHRACREHGGDMDIHAENLELLRAGASVPVGIPAGRLILAVFLTAADIAVIVRLLQKWRRG
jgi:hypothetical protein